MKSKIIIEDENEIEIKLIGMNFGLEKWIRREIEAKTGLKQL